MKKLIITVTILFSILLTSCSFNKENTDSSSETSKVSLVKEKSSNKKIKTKDTSKTATSKSSLISTSSSDNSSSSITTKENSSSSANSEMSFDEAANLIEKGGFTDFNFESAQSFHDGSHPTSNGGYVMITYPGAKGMDTFTITKVGENTYHIEAEYGSLDGGSYTKYPDDGTYGPSSADVTR